MPSEIIIKQLIHKIIFVMVAHCWRWLFNFWSDWRSPISWPRKPTPVIIIMDIKNIICFRELLRKELITKFFVVVVGGGEVGITINLGVRVVSRGAGKGWGQRADSVSVIVRPLLGCAIYNWGQWPAFPPPIAPSGYAMPYTEVFQSLPNYTIHLSFFNDFTLS